MINILTWINNTVTSEQLKPEVKDVPKYPWKQELKTDLKRCCYHNMEESEILKIMRDKELENPAPFSHRTLIPFDNASTQEYESPIDKVNGELITYSMDVPVINIVGAGTNNNMGDHGAGKTYREILFECLHGAGIDHETMSFLLSSDNKNEEMPHTPIKGDPKTSSRGALTLQRYGNFFFSTNGHQRTVLAMYWIWQNEGNAGLLKNVTVIEKIPLAN